MLARYTLLHEEYTIYYIHIHMHAIFSIGNTYVYSSYEFLFQIYATEVLQSV